MDFSPVRLSVLLLRRLLVLCIAVFSFGPTQKWGVGHVLLYIISAKMSQSGFLFLTLGLIVLLGCFRSRYNEMDAINPG